ncbi:PIN domain-containing protein [Herbiconiux sp. CPCC 205763]|uniref:Ribonuclease VapC n=1 Tax=Herbiconiux aconitum TaxID=2970913 RepID=A0ABT2GW23_9MICO|nr:TA system VapC family ribonuclease toxin [Herbiconiux aconitum]MCS5720363.1 PIN domain-containing protein [Herbiconiux aconitum]
MRAVDTNVLVHAFLVDSPLHEKAATAVRELAESPAAWAIPWPCIHEFYAVVTNPKIFPGAALSQAARRQIDIWRSSPSLQLLGETSSHWATLERLLDVAAVVGPRVHDARIAAICVDHGVSDILTQDRDFARFEGVAVVNLE